MADKQPEATLEITIGRLAGEAYPVFAEHRPAGIQLASRKEGDLQLGENWSAELLALDQERRQYGSYLGRALFWGAIRDAFMSARGQSPDGLRLLLVVEDPDLRALHWERLCAPIGPGGDWVLLALDARTYYSNFLPSLADRRFPAIGRRDLKALVLVANPAAANDYGLAPFDREVTIAGLQTALDDVEFEVLASPTLSELVDRLSQGDITLLHIVAHGQRASGGETVLYLLDDEGQVRPVPATRLVERLANLSRLPHLAFLATCESAAPGEGGAGSLGSLAQRLVRELGFPAVIAMSELVSIPTASALAQNFYDELGLDGHADRALATAMTRLAERDDVTVCALYGRLGDRPLFSDALDRELTAKEIAFGLETLAGLLPERAPVLIEAFDALTATISGSLEADPAALSPEAARDRSQALESLEEMALQAIDLSFGALALGQQPPAYDGRSPFRGLYAFQQKDSPFFFGRRSLVDTLLTRLSEANFLAVLGASGSGKSSLVLAGVLPRLAESDLPPQVSYLTPGAEPVARLVAARQNLAGGPRVTVVDQFEELFTLCGGEEQRLEFVDQMLAICEQEPLILTMRADFWGECARYEPLKEAMVAHQELIAPMTTAQLRSAMDQQAAAVGLRFEAGLSHTMLDAVRDEPGAMPLLQHALRQLWRRRHGRWLLAAEYRAIGGVQRAIAGTAERIYTTASEVEQEQMRDIFLRLTRLDDTLGIGEGRRDTRQRVRFEELVPAGRDQADIRRLVSKLADERLLITGRDLLTGIEEVEVAHEALIHHWPRLQEWLHENRDLLRLRAGIRQTTQEWLANDRDTGFLFRGARLTSADEFLTGAKSELNQDEIDFLEASLAERSRLELQQEEQRRKEEQLRAEQKNASRFRRLTALAAALFVIAVIAAGLAVISASEAGDNAERAQTRQARADDAAATAVLAQETAEAAKVEAEESEAEVQYLSQFIRADQLAAESELVLDSDQELALLLAWTAVETIRQNGGPADNDAELSLYNALAKPYRTTLYGHEARIWFGVYALDGGLLVTTSDDGTARLWDPAAGRQMAVLSGHQGPVFFSAYNPDTEQLATSGDDGTVRLWNAATGAEEAVLAGHEGPVYPVAYSPDKDQLLSAGEDGTIRLWDVTTGQEQSVLTGHQAPVWWAVYNPKGGQLATASEDGTARLWSATTGEEEAILRGHVGSVNLVAYSPDGSRLVTAGEDGTARVWDAVTGQDVAILAGHAGPVWWIGYDSDGSQLATAGDDGTVRLWEANSGEEALVLSGHDGPIWWLAFSPDGRQVATAGDEGKTILWDTSTGAQDAILSGHDGPVWWVGYSPDGAQLATVGVDGAIRLWAAKMAEKETILDGHTAAVNTVVYSPDGAQLATAGREGTIRLWDASTGREVTVLNGDQRWINAVVYSPDGTRLATAGGDGTTRIWDVSTGREVAVLDGRAGEVEAVAFSPSGEQLATASEHGTARLWDTATGRELAVLDDHLGGTNFVIYSPDGSRVATSDDWSVRLWDATTGEEQASLSETAADFAVFSPDGEQLAIDGGLGKVVLWDVATVQPVAALRGHSGGLVNGVTYSPDGRQLATAGGDGTARLWDAETGDEMVVLSGHAGPVNDVVYSPDGRQLATASSDGTAWLWDIATGQVTAVLSGHEDAVNAVAFSPDGKQLATASDDRTARLWKEFPGYLMLAEADRRLQRGFTGEECARYFADDLDACPGE